ncbi:uncharacterized protein [Procambarus clarkii]|uniref:uncharacterized protein n=1 Tax=Procambarus clarkii TaxID=6728 RepID=UPI003743CCFC
MTCRTFVAGKCSTTCQWEFSIELANCRSESHRNAVDRVKRLKKAYKFAMKCINIYEKMHTQQKTELKELEMQLTRKEQELLEERKKIIKLENKLKVCSFLNI